MPDETVLLSEVQILLLERHCVEFRFRHVEASRPGELLNQDTCYWAPSKARPRLRPGGHRYLLLAGLC
jgi:hypothetical protein